MNAERNEGLFLQFVMSLMQSGMIQLGKVMNPMTQKVERDLHGVQATIDMLMMLKDKTKGNLSKTEETFLTNALSSLQMNYVDEVEAEAKKPAGKEAAKSEQKEDGESAGKEKAQPEQKEDGESPGN